MNVIFQLHSKSSRFRTYTRIYMNFVSLGINFKKLIVCTVSVSYWRISRTAAKAIYEYQFCWEFYILIINYEQLTSSFFFSFGVLQLMLPEAHQPYRLLYYLRVGVLTFSTSPALPRPLSRESCSCNPVIYMCPTFATSRLREILATKGGNMWAKNGR
jgi:hypothetical protein